MPQEAGTHRDCSWTGKQDDRRLTTSLPLTPRRTCHSQYRVRKKRTRRGLANPGGSFAFDNWWRRGRQAAATNPNFNQKTESIMPTGVTTGGQKSLERR